MPLTQEKKEEIIARVKERGDKSKIVIFTNFHGLGMEEMTKLRQNLRQSGADYMVVKKRLLKRGLGEGVITEKTSLDGEVGVVFGYEEPTAAAKATYEFAKANKDAFSLLGGIFENREVGKTEVTTLATIPSREVLLGQLVGVLAGPMRGLVVTLAGVPRGFVQVLHQAAEKKSYR